jgi:hypothetical protein
MRLSLSPNRVGGPRLFRGGKVWGARSCKGGVTSVTRPRSAFPGNSPKANCLQSREETVL